MAIAFVHTDGVTAVIDTKSLITLASSIFSAGSLEITLVLARFILAQGSGETLVAEAHPFLQYP